MGGDMGVQGGLGCQGEGGRVPRGRGGRMPGGGGEGAGGERLL